MKDASYEVRLSAGQKARSASPPEPDLTPATPSRIDRVRMRDGVTLYTEIYLSGGQGYSGETEGRPVILLRSPYPYSRPSRNDKRPICRYTEAGYAVVFQLIRGQGESEGTFRRYFHEVNDGYDTIEWLASQPWCNGNVGMEGPSYLGNAQLLAARAKPPALKCIMPTACPIDYKYWPFVGGVAPRGLFIKWNKIADAESMEQLDAPHNVDLNVLNHPLWGPAMRKRPLIDAAEGILEGDKLTCWKETVSNPLDDAFWQAIQFTDDELAALEIPIFFTDGWYDMTIGPVDLFTRLEKLQPERPDRYLLVGPWNHQQTYAAHLHDQDNGERVMPENGAMDLVAQRLAFYDCYLKNTHENKSQHTDPITTFIQPNRVRVYITGANVWRDYPTFPVPDAKEQKLYLQSQGDAHSFPGDGVLSWEAPLGTPNLAVVDHYIYNPELPTPSESEPLRDRRGIELRSDVLVYTTEPLIERLTILGEIKLVLYAASDALDTDWFATVTEVFPDGKSVAFHYTISALRARYHRGFDQEVLLKSNQPEVFTIPLGPAGHQVAVGNCLRLSIYSASFPHFDPNTNTGKVAATDTDCRVTRQTVYHDTLRPSHLSLPIIELE